MKFVLKWVARLLAVIVFIALAGVLTIGFTDFGANFAVREITKRIASPDLAVRVGRVSAPLTGHFTVASVEVSDINGPYLTVESVDLRWSPLALLRGRFAASSLSAQIIDLERLPAAGEAKPEQEKTASAGGFSLPIGIAVDQFNFPTIDIGASVLGESYPLSASGHIEAVKDRISAVLDGEHRARPSTYIKADVEYAPDDNRLDLEAEVNEPQGGIVATMLKLTAAPALNIKLDGDGTLADWKGNINAQLAGKQLGSIDIAHQLDNDDTRSITVTGNGQFAPLAPEQFRSFVEGQTDLDIGVAISPSGRIAINKGNIKTGSFVLNASGVYDPEGQNNIKAELNGTDGPVAIKWPLGDETLEAELKNVLFTLNGNAQKATLQASVNLNKVSLPSQGSAHEIALVANSEGFNLQSQTGKIDTTLTIGNVALAQENLKPLVQAPITLKAPVEITKKLISVQPATLESGAIGGSVNLSYDLNKGQASGDAKLFVLADALPPAAASMISGMTKIESQFTADTAGNIHLSQLTIENNLAAVNGNVDLADGQIDADITASFDNLSAIAKELSGKAKLSVTAKGALAKPDVDAKLIANTLEIAGEKLENFILGVKGIADMEAPSGSISASGTYANAPLTLAADVTSLDGTIQLKNIAGKVGENTLSGSLALNQSFLPSGGINFSFPNLKLLAGLAGQSASGGISGRIALDNADNKLGVSLNAAGDTITFDTISAKAISADITVADIAALKANGNISVGTITVSGNTISNLALTARNEGSSTTFDLTARYQNDPIEIAASVTRGQTMEIDLTKLEGSPMGLNLNLSEPGKISIANGTATIQKLTIGIGGGTISANGTAGEALNINVAINTVSPSLANAFVPGLGAQGSISGTVRATGSTSNPTVDYDLRLTNGSVAQTQKLGIPGINIATTGRYANNRVTTDTNITNARELNIRANGSVGLGGSIPLNLTIKGALPVTSLSEVAADAGFAVAGTSSVDLTVGGQASNPVINGGINLNITSVTDLRRNIALNNINGRLTFTGDRIVTENIKGNMNGGGTLVVDGPISFKGSIRRL